MRICLVGDYTGDPDEGLKNIAFYLASNLEDRGHAVHRSNVTKFYRARFYHDVRAFDPDIIHYVPGIGWKNILLTRGLSALTGARVAISAVDAKTHDVPLWLLKALGPAVVFTQDGEAETLVRQAGQRFRHVPNGVDTDRFRPLPEKRRREVRESYDIDPDAFVVLHVGHLTEKRNLSLLTDLQNQGHQVVVAASKFFDSQTDLVNELVNAGCQLVRGYVSNIEELYASADCYVFPTAAGDTIQMPLSVLEAMACNCPVVTREHPGVTDALEEGGGLYFEASDQAIVDRVDALAEGDLDIHTAEKVKPFSWGGIADIVLDEYAAILEGDERKVTMTDPAQAEGGQ